MKEKTDSEKLADTIRAAHAARDERDRKVEAVQDEAWDLVYKSVSAAVRAEVEAEESALRLSLYAQEEREEADALKIRAKEVWLENPAEKCGADDY